MRISVLGAGAWGTAMAVAAAPRHEVLLWARDEALVQQMSPARRNTRYLPEVAWPESLRCTSDLPSALAHCADGLLVLACPMAGLRPLLERLPDDRPAVWLCKGFERDSGLLGHEIARAVRPRSPCAVLSGPSFALEVARAQPTALVAAGENDELIACALEAFHSEALRIYSSHDIVGVEVGGAVKNVLAIAAGIIDGLAAAVPAGTPGAPGLNARAALITRGLAEMTRLGVALGADAETFMGLSGLGDLVLTATGALSRNRKVGLRLAAGVPLAQVLSELGHVAEGVYCAGTVMVRATRLGVEMPISAAVSEVLEGRAEPAAAIRQLMSRQPRAERHKPPA